MKMSANFLGVSKHTLESNNRIIIPSRFRESLAPEFVLFKAPDGCISIYDTESFNKLLEQVRMLTNTKEGRMKARTLTRAARYMTLDKQGRFTIPQDYVDYAELTETVYITGEANHLEIWNETDYLAQQSGDVFEPDMYPEIFY